MQVKHQQLLATLQRGLQNVYLISGDETLLVSEACDSILQHARTQGFTERSLHHVESGFKWHDLTNDAASMSLFAERKVIDLRIPPGKFDKEASQIHSHVPRKVFGKNSCKTCRLSRSHFVCKSSDDVANCQM